MSLQPFLIAGSDIGLETDVQPYILPDKGFTVLNNAYVFRERVLKRQGWQLLGRLARNYPVASIGNSSSSPWTFNIYSIVTPAITEPNKEIQPGSVTIVIGAITFTDQGNGILVGNSTPASNYGVINYVSGEVTITTTAAGGTAATITLNYFPSLPALGIKPREQPTSVTPQPFSFTETIFFDTTYAYINSNNQFIEWIPGSTWAGQDYSQYWTTNYQGSDSSKRLFFVTNFINTSTNPMRYTDGSTWTTFAPAITASQNIFSARILIPYYGRLLALNTWEGAAYGNLSNFYARCAFSAIGNPVDVAAWRRDIFGKGGSIDAPTAEAIVSAIFWKNTLIVNFERSTWQLRYVGDYGIPFVWERISSDFGLQATFSNILFDQGVLGIGSRAIIEATSGSVNRIDEKIPDLVFGFENMNNGSNRICGVRDFQRELVFWNYVDSNTQSIFPTNVLVYNYRNKTFAQFRDNVTCFGTFPQLSGITWNSTNIFWDNTQVTWDNSDNQTFFPYIAAGNQQGFIGAYGYVTPDQPSLSVTGITFTPDGSGYNIQIIVNNHNLNSDETILLSSLNFTAINMSMVPVSVSNTLNSVIFGIASVVDQNTLNLHLWQYDSETYTNMIQNVVFLDAMGNSYTYLQVTYAGGGQLTLFPKLDVQTKDFNPFQKEGKQAFISYIDFLTDDTIDSEMTINLYVNSNIDNSTNLLLGNNEVETSASVPGIILKAFQTNPCKIYSPQHSLISGTEIQINNVIGMTQLNTGPSYIITVIDANNFSLDEIDATGYSPYISGGNWFSTTNTFFQLDTSYSWHRFFATSVGQYIRVEMTYDDNLMNSIVTHQNNWVLNGINLFMKPAGKMVF